MKHRIAIPIEKGSLGCQFGLCKNFMIYTINDNGSINSESCFNSNDDIVKQLEWLKAHNVTDIIAYKINRELIELIIKNTGNTYKNHLEENRTSCPKQHHKRILPSHFST